MSIDVEHGKGTVDAGEACELEGRCLLSNIYLVLFIKGRIVFSV
jgi:hypothetical protein